MRKVRVLGCGMWVLGSGHSVEMAGIRPRVKRERPLHLARLEWPRCTMAYQLRAPASISAVGSVSKAGKG